MAVKSIKIDLEAYERLKSAKLPDESFSQTIKRVVQKPFDLEAWFRRIEKINLSQSAVDAIEDQVKGRRKRLNRENGRAIS